MSKGLKLGLWVHMDNQMSKSRNYPFNQAVPERDDQIIYKSRRGERILSRGSYIGLVYNNILLVLQKILVCISNQIFVKLVGRYFASPCQDQKQTVTL